ncbi:MAG: zinc ribbon domain-containing protein [Pseudomonadota bacterium]
MQCPRCQRELPPGAAGCPDCGPAGQTGQTPPPPPPPPPGVGPDPAAPAISEAEWRAFLGPKAELYLARFARFSAGGQDAFAATWHWPGFFATAWWFLYRKLYLWFGLGLVGSFIPWLRWGVHIAAGLTAYYIYYVEAGKQIRAIKAATPPELLAERLAAAGGVHRWVPWVAVVVTALMLLGTILMLSFAGGLALGVLFGSASAPAPGPGPSY